MTAGKPVQHRLRLGFLSSIALIILTWCSYQWKVLLRSRDLQISTHIWWHHSSDGAIQNQTDLLTAPRVQYHEWNITRADIAPDGVVRPMVLVNNRFPGPPLQASVGDTLVIKVNNQLSANDASSFREWDLSARARFSSKVDRFYPPGTDERVAIHWHGLSMRDSPEQDGAPGFTSCAILPGSSQTYRFQIHKEDVGTHWWHSHTGMARADGLWGTLTVLDPINRSDQRLLDAYATAHTLPPIEWDCEQVITLGDHYFSPGIEQISWFASRHSLGFEPTPDNVLINGQGTFDCSRLLDPGQHNCTSSRPYPTIQVEQNKRHRLRLINVGSVGHQTFSIDQHTLTVIEADGSIIEPYTTTRLSIAPGQRYSVLVNANQETDNSSKFWLRSEMDYECFNMPNPNLEYHAKAVVQYVTNQQFQESSMSSPKDNPVRHSSYDLELRTSASKRSVLPRSQQIVLPQTHAWPRKEGEEPCHDEQAKLLRPLRSEVQGAPRAPQIHLDKHDQQAVVTVTMPKLDRNGLVPVSWINRTQWTAPSVPLLRSFAFTSTTTNVTAPGPRLFDPIRQTVLTTHPAESVTLELIINNKDEAPHPFHLHGHKFHVVAVSESNVGFGSYNPVGPNSDAEWFDESTAPYRDTVSVPRRGFAILRWRTDNPGVWAMHCHVLVHMQTGMALAIVDLADKIRQLNFAKNLFAADMTAREKWETAKCPSHFAAAA